MSDLSVSANKDFVLSKTRLPELDGLRGLAILLVLVWHFFVVTSPLFSPNVIAGYMYYLRTTWSGVDLFFVLSGFLIGRILIEVRNSENYFKTFYVRRFCRIVPLYYLVLLMFSLAIVLTPSSPFLIHTHLVENRGPQIVYFLFLQNIWMAVTGHWGAAYLSVAWSLAVEEQFYMILPLLIRYLPLRILPLILIVLIALAPISRILLYDTPEHGGLMGYVLVFCRFDSLGLGVLTAWASTVPSIWSRIQGSTRLLKLLFVISFGGILYFTIKGSGVATSKGMSYYGYSWFAVFYLLMLLLALTDSEGWIARFSRLRFLRYLGTISYGIYLFHEPVNHLWHNFFFDTGPSFSTFDNVLVTFTSLACTIVLADVSWHYFEKRIVHFGHRFKYND